MELNFVYTQMKCVMGTLTVPKVTMKSCVTFNTAHRNASVLDTVPFVEMPISRIPLWY